MQAILVTGAAGAVGRRVLNLLVESPDVKRIVAADRVRIEGPDESETSGATIERVEADLLEADLAAIVDDVDVIVHLAEDRSRDANAGTARSVLERLLDAASSGSVSQFVLLSSALVYGAHGDNPVPITEGQPLRPSNLAHAQLKADLEALATTWARSSGVRLTVLRPAVALSEGDGSWIGSGLRAAMVVRPEQVDPPVQFLHHDDLARAVVHVVDKRLEGVYNVASDGWIGADAFRALRGETEVRLPERAGRLRHRAAMMFADRSLLEGLQPYITHPWVVATDKLRATGWTPEYTSEEVYILGTSAPLLNSLGPQKRQELALGLAGAAGAAALGAAVWAARRLTR
ncbi:MAG: NAD-dependent epimerase/dehydratase family protein [Acidimicrobiia bacterium]|nr:NAD-dependent epimerase/dehydratase family protein [Acidimicrobiia bacterium]